MELSAYIKRPIFVKHNTANLFKNPEYINMQLFDGEHRMACDICGYGCTIWFKLNIENLITVPSDIKITQDNFIAQTFNLQQLKIKPNDCSQYKGITVFYGTNNRSVITKLQQIHSKIGDSCNLHYNYDIDTEKYTLFSSKLSSVFENQNSNDVLGDINNIEECSLCPRCYQWYKLLHPEDDKQFSKIDPFKVFWYHYFEECQSFYVFEQEDDFQIMMLMLDYTPALQSRRTC